MGFVVKAMTARFDFFRDVRRWMIERCQHVYIFLILKKNFNTLHTNNNVLKKK
jgi:hypothetical protein